MESVLFQSYLSPRAFKGDADIHSVYGFLEIAVTPCQALLAAE